jgi:hypothetical protein
VLGREIVLVDEPGASEATPPSTQGIDQPTTFRLKLFIGFYRVQLDLVKCFLFEALVMLNESELSN